MSENQQILVEDPSNLTPQEKRQKFFWELKDLITGAVLPLVIQLLFSCTVVMFADSDDLAVHLIAVIGGNILIAGAYFIFGRQNGGTAYRKYYLNQTKRALENREKQVVFKTGEYSLWKGFVIPVLSCVPYILIQIIELCVPNTFCGFMLRYGFGWAFYPLSRLGVNGAVNFVFIIIPVAAHALGYYLGMKKAEKLQKQALDESAAYREKRRKRGKK